MRNHEFKSINKNSILISAKKIESESKKKKIEDKMQLLMNNLFRIVKNDKINELSYSYIYSLCYEISMEKAGDLLCSEYNRNLENHLTQLYLENLKYLEIEENSFLMKMSSEYSDFINKIVIIQKTLLYHEKNYIAKKYLPDVKTTSKRIYQNISSSPSLAEVSLTLFCCTLFFIL